jgi:hypothetical protein
VRGRAAPSGLSGVTPQQFQAIDRDLSELRYRDIPVGGTLNDWLLMHLYWGHADLRRRTQWTNHVRQMGHTACPATNKHATTLTLEGRLLMTWNVSTPRVDDLMLPVLEQIGAKRCTVILGRGEIPPALPAGVPVVRWNEAASFQARTWRAEYRRCRPSWNHILREVCDRHHLPRGMFEELSLGLVFASQQIEAFLQMLGRSRPVAVLTESDRNHRWSCLVLAARRLGIPTVTLVHGVMGPEAVGFSPILADLLICWGDGDREKLLRAGNPPDSIAVGGCPRLNRDLAVTPAAAKTKLGIEATAPVVLLATSPDRGYLQLAEGFCEAIDSTPGLVGVVRLHPAETMATYAGPAGKHPGVRFMENAETTLDESLAAADIVVVRGSGLGSDALVKRRLVAVFDPLLADGEEPIGNDWDLVHRAGCPHARTPGELAEVLARILSDETFRRGLAEAGERYVHEFCAAFGADSARLIGDIVEGVVERAETKEWSRM